MTWGGSSADLRTKNRTTVELFLTRTAGVEELYAEDGVKELTYATFLTPDGEPLRWAGMEELRKNFGKIRLLREIMNPLELLKTIGGSITMPAPASRY